MTLRFSLLTITAAAAGVSAVANAVSTPAEQTRLGASIQKDLTERDRQAAQRSRGLDFREQAAAAAEQRLRAAAAAMGTTATPKPQGVAPPAEAADRFDELARIYQSMKPKAAAQVFEQLAMEVQVEVANRMRERATAQVMAAMTPKGAAALTMAMAQKGKGPGWAPLQPGPGQQPDAIRPSAPATR